MEAGLFAKMTFDSHSGNFGPAVWTPSIVPGAYATSRNTVIEDSVLGIFEQGGVSTSNLATLPEPTAGVLLLLGTRIVYSSRRSRSRPSDTELCQQDDDHSAPLG